ncbi:MAG TPA: ABC transporter permease [Myxococcaceae bacterium]|nr:ABC transporter permease [Myxococcaceae bacterium]
MTGWLADLRIAVRLLRRRPGWTSSVLATLALAIGANSALFSVLDAALLQPMPYPAPERLLLIGETAPSFEHLSVSYPDYLDWRERTRSFDEMGVFRKAEVNLTGAGAPRRAHVVQASASYFRTLGVASLAGRTFEQDEDRPGGNPVVVLSEDLARKLYGPPGASLGRSLQVDGTPSTVVGVMPRTFRVDGRPELWVPVGPQMVGHTADRGNHPGLSAVARLKKGVSFGEGRMDLETVGRALQQEYAENRAVLPHPEPMQQSLTEDVRGSLWLLMGAVVLVLLIAAANVGSLLLARGTGRIRELAIRGALGAGRPRLVRQLLVESLALALLGGVLGLLLAGAGMQLLEAHRPSSLPDHVALALNARVLLFNFAASVACALLFGLVPAVLGSRTQLHEAMRQGEARMSGGQHRLRVLLVVAEVALALVLVVAAGLTSRALAGLLRLDTGFDGTGVLTFRLSVPESRQRTARDLGDFYQRLVTELRTLPGVEDASYSTLLPLDGPWETSFRSDTQPELPPEQVQFAAFGMASPGYARTLGLRLLAGRWFEPGDARERPMVTVIDERLAKDYYPTGAIGRHLLSNNGKQDREIIGVVRHVAAYGVVGPEPARHQFYLAAEQLPEEAYARSLRSVNVAVRSRTTAEMLRPELVRTVTQLDPELPVYEMRTTDQLLGESVDAQRFATLQLALFALLALILAVLGLYAVLSYSVAQRTHEIGIRMALGAPPGLVLRQVVGQGLAWAGVGLAVGLVGALATTRLLRSVVENVRPLDPAVYAVTVFGLLACAALASWIPARRAVRVDASVALREDN